MIPTLLHSLAGIAGLIGLAWLMSEDRKVVSIRLIGLALAIQVVIALLILKIPFVWAALSFLSKGVAAIDQAARDGAAFVFGYAGGGPSPFPVPGDGTSVIVAFQILPIVIVVSALAALLWHWKILPALIRWLSKSLQKSLGLGGGVSLGCAANLFFGVVESPLFIRGVLNKLNRADLFAVMTAGLATVSGVVLVLYATILEPVLPGATSHIVTASVISLPAALLVARIMIPGNTSTTNKQEMTDNLSYDSSLDAVVQGTMDGMKLYLAIVAILIVVFAFVSLGDQMLGLLPDVAGAALTIDRLFGWVFAPIVLLYGIPPGEAIAAGQLMGTKAVLNEFVAYQALGGLDPDILSSRSTLIMTYALCGFANLASVGMLVSVIGTLAPVNRSVSLSLGMKSWIAGNLATGLTGAVIGLIT
ncbi:MAG: nucleoside transporter C-terminal domain-containing protein [Rhodospirillaceae bacterium]|nr:nucleoside transporter C-terminal domain-containing protein [Rhodospirillaceae bacterium]